MRIIKRKLQLLKITSAHTKSTKELVFIGKQFTREFEEISATNLKFVTNKPIIPLFPVIRVMIQLISFRIMQLLSLVFKVHIIVGVVSAGGEF